MVAAGERFVKPDRWLLGVLHASRKELISGRGGVSAAGFARLVLCSEGTVRRYLRGERPIPTSVLQAWERATRLAPGTLTSERGRGERPTLLDERPPLPALASVDTRPFVGRRRELEVLRQALAACSDRRQAVFVGGDPGIGKTRLAAVAAQSAFDSGATVLWGRCDDHLRLPFQPFADALRPFVPNFAALIVPDLETGRAAPLPDLARERLFEDVTDLIATIAANRPTLLVVDDAHWASRSSIDLLRHLLLVRRDIAVAVVLTYNTAELHGSPLADQIEDLTAIGDVARAVLDGLAETEVRELVAARTTVADRDAVAASLYAETGGNPFFVGEMLQEMAESEAPAAADGTRADVQAVLGRRLRRRSPHVRDVLSAAAVVGQAFEVRVVATMLAHAHADTEIVAALEEARNARLVEELGPLRYRFTHNLVRRAVLVSQGATQLALLHRSTADALEAVHADGLDRVRADLAHHLHAAGSAVPLDRRLDALQAAAEQCVAQLDVDGAKQHASVGLSLLEDACIDDPARRCDLLTLGVTHAPSGDADHWEWARLAADDAERIGDYDRMAKAVECFAANLRVGAPNTEAIELCTRCLDLLPPDDDLNHARVLAVLVLNMAWSTRGGAELQVQLGRLGAQAAERGEHLDDPRVRSNAYEAWLVALDGSSDLALRLQVADRAGTNANGVTPWHKAPLLLASGDRAGFEAIVERFALSPHHWDLAAAEEWRAMLALAEGRWDDATAHTSRAVAASRSDTNFEMVSLFQTFVLLWETGQLHDVVAIAEQAAAEGYAPTIGALGLVCLEVGEHRRARKHLSDLIASTELAPRDFTWTATLAILIELGARLDEPDAVKAAAKLLAPFRGQLIVVGTGTHVHGAADRFLAIAASSEAMAQRLFRSAIRLESQIGASALTRRTRMWQARALQHSASPTSRRRGDQFREDVLGEARAAGQHGLVTLQS